MGVERVEDQVAAERWRFYPIVAARAHEEVVDQIIFSIRAGAYRAGDRLPRVDQLARMMAVSKPVIGEALRVLSQAGIIATKRGATGGIEVLRDEPSAKALGMGSGWHQVNLVQILEARRPVETEIAILAALRGTADDFAEMERTIAELDQTGDEDNGTRWLAADHRFHYALGRAARSDVLAAFQHDVLERTTALLLEDPGYVPDRQGIREAHAETLDAIRSRDANLVRVAMDRHLLALEAFASAQTSRKRKVRKAVASAS